MKLTAFTLFLAAVAAETTETASTDTSSTITLRGKRTPNVDAAYPARCYPDPCRGITFQNETAVCGDPRLGPIRLPTYFPLSTELQTYARLGDLCPYEFLEKWTTNVSDPNASFIYPGAGGFQNDTDSNPIEGNVSLYKGMKVDRFGGETGNFMSPLGAPYIERALPPVNLFAPKNSSFPYNYHVYEVVEPFVVLLGPITPWFQQPGLGTQFKILNGSVADLVPKYLRRLELEEYDRPEDFADNQLPAPPQPSASD